MDTTVVLTTLVIYKIALIAIGIWAQRRVAYLFYARYISPRVAILA